MSATSSDTESSCGWTIISNEGSDIETLAAEPGVEYGANMEPIHPVVEAEVQETPASASDTGCDKEKVDGSPDDTLEEPTIDETLYVSETEDHTAGKEHATLFSSSDHSDIMTLGDMKEGEHAEVEVLAAASEEFYLGMSCSSQYSFTAADTGKHPSATNSSSEDEGGRSSNAVVRRRRLRRTTTSIVTESEEEEDEALESGLSEEEEEEEEEDVKEDKQQEAQTEVRPAALDVRMQGPRSTLLNQCILLALIIAISMGFGHFHGTVQIQERQKMVDKVKVNELDGVRNLLQRHAQRRELVLDNLDEQEVISLLSEVIKKMKKENKELNIKQAHIQSQRDDLEMLLKQKAAERMNMLSQQQRLTADNQQLKSSLEQEENTLSTLQEELRNLRSKIQDLEAMGAELDLLPSENQRLKEKLGEEQQLIQSLRDQRGDMMFEAQTLRKELDQERKVTNELRREINRQSTHIPGDEKKARSDAKELQSRLIELERRLSFEQQRSDLWERLYLETKEERAKGDMESEKVKKPKGKVEETFDAVKNSTKEFVHHHKEQIKKAKEAVKENLRKFSDSVKSTFRHFKDSASTFINKARSFYKRKRDDRNTKESWQGRYHKTHHKHSHKFDDSFQGNQNTRKTGDKVHKEQGQNTRKANVKGCSGIFDCANQESMSLFNKAMDPIRADEFYKLLHSYLQQEVEHFHHWKELGMFIKNFFHNGVFIHDRMLFTDFISRVEDYLADMQEYHGLDDDVFGDFDEYVYRHFFGESYTKSYGQRPDVDTNENSRTKHQQRRQQRDRPRPRPHNECKWSRSGRTEDRHKADVK